MTYYYQVLKTAWGTWLPAIGGVCVLGLLAVDKLAVVAVDVAALVAVVAEVEAIGQLVVAGLVVVPGQQEAVLHSQG